MVKITQVIEERDDGYDLAGSSNLEFDEDHDARYYIKLTISDDSRILKGDYLLLFGTFERLAEMEMANGQKSTWPVLKVDKNNYYFMKTCQYYNYSDDLVRGYTMEGTFRCKNFNILWR